MAEPFQFELVSPERLLMSEAVIEVVVPGTEGEFGVLKDHAPFMSTMKPGILKVHQNEQTLVEYFIRGGFADVSPSGLTVLAEVAIPVQDLKAEDIAAQIRDAEEDVADAADGEARDKAKATLAQLHELEDALKGRAAA